MTGRREDVPLDPPLARHADVVPAREDRSYIIFIAAALVIALGAGFVLAVLVSLAESGVFLEARAPWLIQAHGAAQLEGWAGLFVAGMGLRLLPRFAGRRPLPTRINLLVFVPLASGVVLRTVSQCFPHSSFAEVGLLVSQVSWALGSTILALVVSTTLLRGRGRGEPWHAFALAGAACWLAWAVAAIAAGVRGARNDAYVPSALDDPMTWMVLLGSIGNFIWAVQGRSVPVFFGRRPPTFRKVAVPGGLLNAGVLLLFVALFLDAGALHERLVGSGFLLAGVAIAWVAPIAGAAWGKPTRLRPRARSAARFVLAANIAAIVCGLLLAWAGLHTVIDAEFASPGVRDAARHAFGVGVITPLIIGMAQLVAPFFAIQRAGEGSRRPWELAMLGLVVGAAILRVAAGLLYGHVSVDARMHVSALAGAMAWTALLLFALMILRALREAPRIRASMVAAVSSSPRHQE